MELIFQNWLPNSAITLFLSLCLGSHMLGSLIEQENNQLLLSAVQQMSDHIFFF